MYHYYSNQRASATEQEHLTLHACNSSSQKSVCEVKYFRNNERRSCQSKEKNDEGMANVWLILGGSLSLQMMLSNLPTHLHTSHNRLLTFILPSGEAGLPWHYFPELAMTFLLFNRRCEGVLRQGRKAWMGRAKNRFSLVAASCSRICLFAHTELKQTLLWGENLPFLKLSGQLSTILDNNRQCFSTSQEGKLLARGSALGKCSGLWLGYSFGENYWVKESCSHYLSILKDKIFQGAK